MLQKGLKGLIFDLDGTLVDSRLDFDQIRQDLGFPAKTPILEHLSTFKDENEILRCKEIIHRHEIEGARNASWMPGAQDLLAYLNNRGIPTAILTRNQREAVEITRQSLGIGVEIVLTREDCRPKPDPEGLLLIAGQWQVSPEHCAYIGDFVFDLQAARNAGMQAWLYRNDRNSTYEPEADRVFHHFDEIRFS